MTIDLKSGSATIKFLPPLFKDNSKTSIELKPASPLRKITLKLVGQTFSDLVALMSYTLTASRILCGEKPWHQIGKFVKAAAEIAGRRHRDFVTRDDLIETGKNFNDYLRVCCQLGLFKKRDAGGRRKAYMLTPFAKLIAADPEQKNAQKAILNSINEIVTREDEYQSDQGERHAVFLLWYYLKLKERGVTPTEVHFRRQAENNYFPLIRLQFTTGLYRYLFNSNNIDEIDFITGWDSILKEQRTHNQW